MQVCAAQHAAARLELLSLEVKSHKQAAQIKRCGFLSSTGDASGHSRRVPAQMCRRVRREFVTASSNLFRAHRAPMH
jgi:hypothetical protein